MSEIEKEDIKEKEMLVLEELSKAFPNKDVSNITISNPALYYKVVRIAFAYDQTTQQWLKSKGFTYITSNARSRLSANQISNKEREADLLPLKKTYFDYFTVDSLRGTVGGKKVIEMKRVIM